MAERFSDERLDAVLASVGRHLVVREGISIAPRLEPVRRSRVDARTLALAAAALLLVLVVAAAVIAPVRDAVADWLGIGSTTVEQVPAREADPTGLPGLAAGAVPISPSDARTRLGRPLPVVTDRRLGRARRFAVPEGGVLMAWPRGQTTLWVRPDDGEVGSAVKKLVHIAHLARTVDGLGDAALLIDGPHVLQTPSRRLAAGRVLLWSDDGLQLRLESNLDRAQMLAIARSVRAAG